MGLKRVSFHGGDDGKVMEAVCLIPHRQEIDEEQMKELFYSRHEFQEQRISAKTDSRESSQTGTSGNLEEAFSEKSKASQQSLNEWSSKGEAARGLERWANRDHGEKRQLEQFSAVMAVLQAQDDSINSKKPLDDEVIRKVSHKATRTARHFARMMGKADSYAISEDMKGAPFKSPFKSSDTTMSLATTMSVLTTESDFRRFNLNDDESVTPSVGGSVFSSSLLSLPSLTDDIDIDLPKKRGDGKQRRFRFSFGRKNQKNLVKENGADLLVL
jgi:hypothetical protein